MTNVNANVFINVNTKSAIAQVQALQNQVNSLNRTLALTGNEQGLRRVNQGFLDAANASGQFRAKIIPVTSSVDQFTQKLEKNKFTMGEYTRYAGSQIPGLGRMFRNEFDTMQRVAESRVRKIATAYTSLGESANGARKAIALTPTGALNMRDHAVQAELAAQKAAIFNKMLRDGSTRMLNWGKNTQWAGRQLMVGFSIPLAMLGTAAAKTFKELDKASVSFRRVYGDLSTTTEEMERNLQAVKDLGQEYTKYGIAVADTIDLAARVAATGAENESLLAATTETLRLATLGQMEYNTALDATISMQTAFKISNDDLAGTIDYLNAVENQTILTMEDMAAAIPRVAPVIKGLGGDVQDLAVMMTALREGGVTAEQGANAIKSGLGRLINPTKAAREEMLRFGISITSIIQSNKGDLMGMITGFGDALAKLGEFEQQQVLEKVFGKYQYARLGALFKNISNDAGQASRAMELAGMSASDLAKLSEKELGKISESTSVKFEAAMERLKVAISPIGEQFMKAIMPIVEFFSKLFDKFNEMPDVIKNVVVIGTAALAGLGPVILMTVGLMANGLANITKGAILIRNAFNRLRGSHKSLEYQAAASLEAATATGQLEGRMSGLTGVMLNQQVAIRRLIGLYTELATAASAAASKMPASMGGTRARRLVRANKGLTMVPGTGNKDTVPALLTPGESVITKEATAKYAPILEQMNAGKLPGFSKGTVDAKKGGRGKQSKQSKPINPKQINPEWGADSHRSHMLGMQMQEVPESLAAAWKYADSIGDEEIKNQVKNLIRQSISKILKDEDTINARWKSVEGSGKGYVVEGRKKPYKIVNDKVIESFLFGKDRAIRVTPSSYSLTSIAASPYRNSAFIESKELNKLKGGEAITLKDWRGQVKKAKHIVDNPEAFSEGLREGAQDILDENEQFAKNIKTEKEFLKYRLKQSYKSALVAEGIVTRQTTSTTMKYLDEKIDEIVDNRLKQLEDMGIFGKRGGLSKGINNKVLAGLLFSQIAQSGFDGEALGLKKQKWFVSRIKKLERLPGGQKLIDRVEKEERLEKQANKYIRNKLKKDYLAGDIDEKTYKEELKKIEEKGALKNITEATRAEATGRKNFLSRAVSPTGLYQDPRMAEFLQIPMARFGRMMPAMTLRTAMRSFGMPFFNKGGAIPQSNKMFYADGGPTVPGLGNTDTVPAMLTPGEFVVNKQATKENAPLLHAINSGKVSQTALGFNKGGMIPGIQYFGRNMWQRIVQPMKKKQSVALPSPISNPYQQKNIESQLSSWLDGGMSKVNIRELSKLGLAQVHPEKELFRGMRLKPIDGGSPRFSPEIHDAFYRYSKTGNVDELSGVIGKPIAIGARSFSKSEKSTRPFSTVAEDDTTRVSFTFKIKDENGIYGIDPYQNVGKEKQSSRHKQSIKTYKEEKEIIPIGKPKKGRPDVVVGRIALDENGMVVIDAGAKLSRKEIAAATKEYDATISTRTTPKEVILKTQSDIQNIRNKYSTLKSKGDRVTSKEAGDLYAELTNLEASLSKIRFLPRTKRDKKIIASAGQSIILMKEDLPAMFSRAQSLGLNSGGTVPSKSGAQMLNRGGMVQRFIQTLKNKKDSFFSPKFKIFEGSVAETGAREATILAYQRNLLGIKRPVAGLEMGKLPGEDTRWSVSTLAAKEKNRDLVPTLLALAGKHGIKTTGAFPTASSNLSQHSMKIVEKLVKKGIIPDPGLVVIKDKLNSITKDSAKSMIKEMKSNARYLMKRKEDFSTLTARMFSGKEMDEASLFLRETLRRTNVSPSSSNVPLRMNQGGMIPGTGNKDTIPALLTPGESVVTKEATAKYAPIIQAMNDGTIALRAKAGDAETGGRVAPQTEEWQRLHFDERIDITDQKQQRKILREKMREARKEGRSYRSFQKALKRMRSGEESKTYLYSNRVVPGPKFMNFAPTPEQASSYVNNPDQIKKSMRGFGKLIAKDLRMTIDSLMKSKGVKEAFESIGEDITKKVNAAIDKGLKGGDLAKIYENAVADGVKKYIIDNKGIDDNIRKAAIRQSIPTSFSVRFKDKSGKFKETTVSRNSTAKRTQERYGLNPDEPKVMSYKNKKTGVSELPAPSKEVQRGKKSKDDAPQSKKGPLWALTNKQRKAALAQAQEEAKRNAFLREEDRKNFIEKRKTQIEEKKMGKNKAKLIAKERDFLKERGLDHKKATQVARKNIEAGRIGSKVAEKRARARQEKLIQANRGSVIVPPEVPEKIAKAIKKEPRLFRRGETFGGDKVPTKFTSGLQKTGTALARGSMPLSMTMGMGSMIPMIAQDEEGKFMGMNANTAMMGMMGGSAVLGLLPMLSNPVVIAAVAGVGAAAGAVGFSLYKWRDSVDSAARETATLGANVGGASNALSNMANILGKADPLEVAKTRQIAIAPEQVDAYKEYTTMLTEEGGAGSKFINELKAQTSKERFDTLSSYIKNAVAAGLMDVQSAKLFSKAVAVQLSDAMLGIRAAASVANQKSGVQAMLGLAAEREQALLARPEVQNVINSTERDSVSSTDTAMLIGGAMQVVKSYKEAAALAEQDYINGKTSWENLIDAIDRAANATDTWTEYINKARINTDDSGATAQATKIALDAAGIDDKQQGAIIDAFSSIENLGNTTVALFQSEGSRLKFVDKEGKNPTGLGSEYAFQKAAELASQYGFGKDVQGVSAFFGSEQYKDNATEFFDLLTTAREEGKLYAKAIEGGTDSSPLLLATQQLAAETGDVANAISVMKSVAGDPEALKAFMDSAGRGASDLEEALGVVNKNILISGDELKQRFYELSDSIPSAFGKQDLLAYVEAGATETDKRTRISEIESVAKRGAEAAANYLATKSSLGNLYTESEIAGFQASRAYQNAMAYSTTTRVAGTGGYSGIPYTPAAPISGGYSGIPATDATEDRYNASKERRLRGALVGAGEAGVSAKIVDYALKVSVEQDGDPARTLEIFTEKVVDLQNLDDEIKFALQIDIDSPVDIEQFGGYSEEIVRGWNMLSGLNPNIDVRFAARAAILGPDGKPLKDVGQIARNMKEINKAYTEFEKAGSSKAKTKAQLELVRQYQTVTEVKDEEGNVKEKITPKDIVKDANDTLNEIGKSLDDMKPAVANQILQMQTFVVSANAERASQILDLQAKYEAIREAEMFGSAELAAMADYQAKIAELQGETDTANLDAAAQILALGLQDGADGGSTGSGGGGGGSESPLKGFKEGILDQTKLWVDADAKLKDLNAAKSNFVKDLIEGNGIFGQLAKVKGIDMANLQNIMGMGPKGAKEFIKKYIKDGKLIEKGQKLLSAANIAGAGQTIGEAVIAQRTASTQTRAANILGRRGASRELIDTIAGDPAKAAQLVTLQKKVNNNIEGSTKAMNKFINEQQKAIDEAEKLSRAMSPTQAAIDDWSKYVDQVNADFDKQYADIEKNANLQFEANNGMTVGLMELEIQKLNDKIDTEREGIKVIEDSIRVLERRNGTAKDYSDWGTEQIQRELDANNKLISELERLNELDQRRVETIQRESEMRSRVSDAINHDLDVMSQAEDEINKSYDKKIEALDEVEKINQRIIEQQQEQLGLSQALSEGDIYAATAAAQQMRASSAQFASEQVRAALDKGRQNEIDSLLTSGGLTREEAEKRIRAIDEQNYQASLEARKIEDEIYRRNLNEILPLKDKEYNLNLALQNVQDAIAAKQLEIRDIEISKIEPIQGQIDKYQELLDDYLLNVSIAQAEVTNEAGETREQFEKMNNWQSANLAYADSLSVSTQEGAKMAHELAKQWLGVRDAIKAANDARDKRYEEIKLEAIKEKLDAKEIAARRAAADAIRQQAIDAAFAEGETATSATNTFGSGTMGITFYKGGKVMKYANGGIAGNGSRDSVGAMLTPGEFVIRKAMVDKYGMPLLSSINQGAFSMPRYNMGQSTAGNVSVKTENTSNIVAPMYNNYSVNVSVSNPNASADEIANKAIMKIQQMQNMQIRGGRGY